MRVVIGVAEGFPAERIPQTIRATVAKYPNAVFLLPEGWEHPFVVEVIREAKGCAISFHQNPRKLDNDAYKIACVRAVVEGAPDAAILFGEDGTLETAIRHWSPDLKVWRIAP